MRQRRGHTLRDLICDFIDFRGKNTRGKIFYVSCVTLSFAFIAIVILILLHLAKNM